MPSIVTRTCSPLSPLTQRDAALQFVQTSLTWTPLAAPSFSPEPDPPGAVIAPSGGASDSSDAGSAAAASSAAGWSAGAASAGVAEAGSAAVGAGASVDCA